MTTKILLSKEFKKGDIKLYFIKEKPQLKEDLVLHQFIIFKLLKTYNRKKWDIIHISLRLYNIGFDILLQKKNK